MSWPRRCGLLFAPLSTVLLIVHGCWLSSVIQADLAKATAPVSQSGRVQGISLLKNASALAPWDMHARADYAWSLFSDGDHATGMIQMTHALALGPADGSLWLDFEKLLLWQGVYGNRVGEIAHLVQYLAPSSPAIQREQTTLALTYWLRVSQSVREAWLPSLQYSLRAQRESVLREIQNSGRTQDICLTSAEDLHLMDWCMGKINDDGRFKEHTSQ